MTRLLLGLVLTLPLPGQVLLSLTIFEREQCKPLLGPACKQLTLAEAVISNYRTEPILVSKARVLENMVYWDLPVVSDVRAAEIVAHRAKDESWGKVARYVDLVAIPVAGGLAVGGATDSALMVFFGKEWLTKAGTAAANRAPRMVENATAILAKSQVTILPGQTDTLTAFTFPAKRQTFQQDIDIPAERFEKPENTFSPERPGQQRLVVPADLRRISIGARHAVPIVPDAVSVLPGLPPAPVDPLADLAYRAGLPEAPEPGGDLWTALVLQ